MRIAAFPNLLALSCVIITTFRGFPLRTLSAWYLSVRFVLASFSVFFCFFPLFPLRDSSCLVYLNHPTV